MFGLFSSKRSLGIEFGKEVKIAEYRKKEFKTKKVKKLNKSVLSLFKGRNVMGVVKSENLNIKFVKVPDNMNEEEIAKMIKLEFNRDDLIIQHEIMEEFNERFVIGMGVSKEYIQNRINMCRDLGLKLKVIETGFHANIRYLSHQYSDLEDIILLLDIGREETDLIVVSNKQPGFVRVLSFGGRQMTEKLAEIEGISFMEAEKRKKAGLERGVLNTVLKELRQQIYHSIDFFQSKYKERIEKIFLTGGGSRLKGIEHFFETHIGINAQKVDDPLFSVVKGLAIREISGSDFK